MDHQNIYIGDEIRNVQHVCGGFIWGTALVWTQRLFKNWEGASNSKSTQIKPTQNFIILDLQMFRYHRYHYFGIFLPYTYPREN